MPTVGGIVKQVKTKHGVKALLDYDWESYGDGSTMVKFVLISPEGNTRIEKVFTPAGTYWKRGLFNEKDVLRNYGKPFDNWVKEINQRKYLRW